MSFVKIHQTILDSSIWLEPDGTRLLWITMLTMADYNGVVSASIGGLAHRANISREACEEALHSLLSPDPDSRTKDHDGRRIEAVPGGWLILNHAIYRDVRTPDQIATAERVRRHRELKHKGVTSNVHGRGNAKPPSDTDTDADNRGKRSSPPSGERMALTEFEQLWKICEKKVAKGEARKAYLSLRRKGDSPSLATLIDALKPLQNSHAWSKDERQFQPNLATWLRREGWLEKPSGNGKGIATSQPANGEYTRWALIQLEDAGKTFDPASVSAAVDPMVSIKEVTDYLSREFNVQPTFR